MFPYRCAARGASSVRLFFRTGALLMLLVMNTAARAQSSAPSCPPPTATRVVHDTYGSVDIADPYRWLEDQNSAETRAWIDAQEKCTEAALGRLPGRAAISKRLTELLHTDTLGIPTEHGGKYFFLKRLANDDLAKIYVRRGATGPEEVLVDPLPWSKDHSASATIETVSRDGKLLFYGRREGGQDEVAMHVLDVDSEKELPDVFPRADYFSVDVVPDNKTVYYVRPVDGAPRAFLHEMGTDPATDKIVYGEGLGKDKIMIAGLSDSGNYLVYLVVHGTGSEQTEVYLQDRKNRGPVKAVVNDVAGQFYPQFGGDRLYVTSTWKAPMGRVYEVLPGDLARDHWREVIPETKVKLETVTPIGGKLVATYTKNASSTIAVFDADGKNEKAIPLPSIGSAYSVSGRWDSPETFYAFATYNAAQTIYQYDLSKNSQSVWAPNKAPFDGSAFTIEQVWYESKDKTRVPMFLFHKKGLKQDGANPVLLTGYGGFSSSETPFYSAFYLYWAESGGVLAVPSLRGGGEFGEDWHHDGMLEKKQNVFDDFEYAAQWLIDNRYTNPARLSIYGVSNGGLLVGAALTQRPELFQAVVCGYPLEDMLRFQKFMDGPYWVAEYGSSDNSEQFRYLRAYSPYQNVAKGKKYPSVLFITGDGDTRVAPLHARKMAAKLQANTGSDRPILLLYDTKSGHSGGRPVNKIIEENTDILSFLAWQLKIPQAGN